MQEAFNLPRSQLIQMEKEILGEAETKACGELSIEKALELAQLKFQITIE